MAPVSGAHKIGTIGHDFAVSSRVSGVVALRLSPAIPLGKAEVFRLLE